MNKARGNEGKPTKKRSSKLASPSSQQGDDQSDALNNQCMESDVKTASPLTQTPEATALHLQAPTPSQFDPHNQHHVNLIRSILAISGERRMHQDHVAPSQIIHSLSPYGRQQQYDQLIQSLTHSIQAISSPPSPSSPSPGCSWYVSGLPGTGKSFTVSRAIEAMSLSHPIPSSSSSSPSLGHPSILSVTLNCMALSGSKDIYAALLDAW